MSSLEKDQLVFLIVKVRFTDGSCASLSHMQTINKDMFSKLLKILYKFLDFNADNYTDRTITQLIFQYHIYTIENSKRQKAKLTESYKATKVPSFKFAGYNLPISTDLETWGIVNELDNNLFKVTHNTREYKVIKFIDKQIVDIMSDDTVLDSFTDIFGESSTSFTRILKNKEFIYKDGELIIKKLVRKTDFINKIKADKKLINKFLTLDIETKTIDNVMVPYCVSIYDGSKFKSFYLTNYLNSDDMLSSAISYLLKRSYNGYKVYIHNLSHFDGIFLFRILSNYNNSILTPVMKDGKMISLKFSWKTNLKSNKTYSIDFRDSYLMFPKMSLNNLSKAFKLDENKGIFPYTFVGNNLDYIGPVPNFKYFSKISVEQYNNYKSNFSHLWNLKQETIKYCELDCKLLWEIINTFNESIFNKYSINIHRFPTLPSLAFGIFRAHYLKENQVPILNGQLYHDIRKSYTGGHTDVYKPVPTPGAIVSCYDVNSLYPSSMNSFPMPTGSITFFEGDILHIEDRPFGFFEVEVETPNDLHIPLLQTKLNIESSNLTRTISPLGTWEGMYFSEEIYKTMSLGYKFKILRGYTFEKGYIFNNFVDFFYEMKQNSLKNTPAYTISKLFLNSLYGKFGMNYDRENHIILNTTSSQYKKLMFIDKIIKTNIIPLSENKELLSFFPKRTNDFEIPYNISVPIAAAITAYGRIHMMEIINYCNENNIQIYYMDTDSLFTDKPLPDYMIGTGLGKLKLENIYKEAVFLAPKVYGGILDNGSELTKVKGFKDAVSYNDLKSILNKDKILKLNQNKWFKSIIDGTIIVKNDLYTLMATKNK